MCCCMCSRRLRREGVEQVVARCCAAQEEEEEADRAERSLPCLRWCCWGTKGRGGGRASVVVFLFLFF